MAPDLAAVCLAVTVLCLIGQVYKVTPH